jgi:DNA-binding PucR family transcriptional regulator
LEDAGESGHLLSRRAPGRLGVTGTPAPLLADRESDAAAREQLSNLQGLLVLSMLMTERRDEREILRLATSSVASLVRARLVGVYMFDVGWREASDAGRASTNATVPANLEARIPELGSSGGQVAISGYPWGHAFPLRGLEGPFGYLVVAADTEPPDAEQFLLRVLAQQTGIALANARLHARERATAVDLRSANAQLAQTVAALERSTAIHERLTRVAGAGEGQQGLAQALHDLTGYPVAVEDRHGNLRAWAGPGMPDPYPKEVAEHRRQVLRRAQLAAAPVRDGDRLVAIASPQVDVLGVLVIVDPAATAGEQEHVALEHAATVLGMELARLRSIAETELRVGRDLAEDLLAGTDEETVSARAQLLGYDVQRRHRVLVVDGGRRLVDDDALFHAARRAARDAGVGTLLVARGATVVVLSDADQGWEDFRLLVCREFGSECRLGVGGPCDELAEFPRSYHEAQLALRVQTSSDMPEMAVEFDRLGVYRILAETAEPSGVERFVHDWLQPLVDYDAQKGTELVLTLSRYLENGGNYDATSRSLSMHRNTLKYRLQRIREISGHDLADADTHFNLQLATRAWQTLRALRAADD